MIDLSQPLTGRGVGSAGKATDWSPDGPGGLAGGHLESVEKGHAALPEPRPGLRVTNTMKDLCLFRLIEDNNL